MLHYYATIFDRSGNYSDAFDDAKVVISTQGNESNELILEGACERIFDVKNYLPQWLVNEDLENKTLLVKFLQHYYDWYYCFELSGIYANKIFDYIDPYNYDENVYLTGLNSSMPGIKNIFSLYNYTPNVQNVIDLLTNIKVDLYQRKGTYQASNILFSTLFDEIISVGINQVEPGNLEIIYFVAPGETIDISMLDAIYQEFLHPYGMIFSSSLQEYSFNNDDSDLFRYNESELGITTSAYEVPKIGNYIVYNMGDTGSLDYTTGCSSASPPPRGITANTANMPTYEHPNWAFKGATAFGNINISEFLFLPYEDNPNIDIPSC